IHLTLVPYIKSSGEMKTKPTQHSVMRLREIGLQPDILLCRTAKPLSSEVREKIGLFCNMRPEEVIDARDVDSIYEVPLMFHRQNLGDLVVRKLKLTCEEPDISKWENFVHKIKNSSYSVDIAICGKYVKLHDAYKSIIESFIHAGVENDTKVNLRWIDSEMLENENDLSKQFESVCGLLVPGGFGERGIEGKIKAIKYARQNRIPFLGICLGLQCAVIEFARSACNLRSANSSEFDSDTEYPVIDLMPDQKHVTDKGGTMRLGAYPCILREGTKVYTAYGTREISERHRHRYELNNNFREILKKSGMIFSGLSPDGRLVEIIELKDHPWFVAVQFHPELKSRVARAHPLFRELVRAALHYKAGKLENR
ncbi:MAG: CTP synthase, partial [Fidelibacterota bacterium]